MSLLLILLYQPKIQSPLVTKRKPSLNPCDLQRPLDVSKGLWKGQIQSLARTGGSKTGDHRQEKRKNWRRTTSLSVNKRTVPRQWLCGVFSCCAVATVSRLWDSGKQEHCTVTIRVIWPCDCACGALGTLELSVTHHNKFYQVSIVIPIRAQDYAPPCVR